MKKFNLFVAIFLFAVTAFAQAPQKMSYQAVVRNSESALVVNQAIGMKISILQGSATGTEVYSETQTTQTNANGLISIEIGNENGFTAIDWSSGLYFLKTEIDPTGRTNYSIVATQQLLSVPFAFHAKTAETDPVFSAWDKSSGISITEQQISDLQNYLTTEIDPAFSAWDKSSGIVITENQISNLQNYLTAELDPTFTAWDKTTGIVITESQISDLQNYLITEIDPVFSAWDKSTGIVITENQISNLQDYLTAELDPTFTAWDKSTGISITESQISDLQNYLITEIDPTFSAWDKTSGIVITESQISDLQTYLTAELDPIYAASIAAGITESDITSWNAKLSSYTETQTLAAVAELGNSVNTQIKNLTNPTETQDAATKAYTDALISQLQAQNEALLARIEALENDTTGGSGSQIVDADGNVYTSVIIGTQEWMAENLKTTRYKNRTAIPNVTDNTEWSNLSTGAYCWYNNDPEQGYGALYNWHAINTGNLCPRGWHVPTDAEWTILINYLATQGYDEENNAIPLKFLTGWNDYQGGSGSGTNVYGFSALPGGDRSYADGTFGNVGEYGYWWSSTENNTNNTYIKSMYNDYDLVDRLGLNKNFGFSVRCLNDNASGSITDADGNVYETVIIGTQEWMKENLKTTKYKDGTTIPNVTDDTEWWQLSTPAYCWYNNDPEQSYGALYNWHAVNTGNLCPRGWHVPTDAEWTTLINYLTTQGYDEENNAIPLKSTTGWNEDGNGTDAYGFSAFPGGIRSYVYGNFSSIGNIGTWWSSTVYDHIDAYNLNMYYDRDYVGRINLNKKFGFSVRCLRN